MGAIKQLAEKCQRCPDRHHCRHKRMEACAYIDNPNIAEKVSVKMSIPAAAPVLRETVASCIDGISTMVYKDELERTLYEQLYKPLSFFDFGA